MERIKGLLFLVGLSCATIGSTAPMSAGQERAVDIIWHSVYGQSDPVPKIRWITGKSLDCNDGRGFTAFELNPDYDLGADSPVAVTVCVEGYTFSAKEVLVAWHGEDSYSQTTIAHELWHVVNIRYGVFDSFHKGEGWLPLSECIGKSNICGIVERANNKVLEQGL